MTSKKKLVASVVGACFLTAAASSPALAKISAEEAARLGKDLTPLGGEVAGNKDGTIPAYTGGLTTPPACYKPGSAYCDPFADEKPLFVITAANMAQYKDKLTEGMLALLKQYPTFKMPVYPTHRTAAVPADVAAKVKAEATKIELNGFAVTNRVDSSTPFPIPKNGVEAIFNHTFRFTGGGYENYATHFPVRANGKFMEAVNREIRITPQNMDKREDNMLVYLRGFAIAPPQLVGTAMLVHEPADQVKETRESWTYNAGQRRTRRAPDFAYDQVGAGTEGMRFADQNYGFNGAPDRFDWKLVGKKEMYVPYNSYKINDKKLKYADILPKNHLNPDFTRYELHRVWVLEATRKADVKHGYSKRVFLLDEDSWQVLAEDAYDTRGGLWRVSLNGTMQAYDASVPWYAYYATHDITDGTYVASGLTNELKDTVRFGIKGKLSDFSPGALRRMGD